MNKGTRLSRQNPAVEVSRKEFLRLKPEASQSFNLFGHQLAVIAVDNRILFGDNPLLVHLDQACVHGYHTLFLGCGDDIINLMYFGFPDHIPYGIIKEHDLKRRLDSAV